MLYIPNMWLSISCSYLRTAMTALEMPSSNTSGYYQTQTQAMTPSINSDLLKKYKPRHEA